MYGKYKKRPYKGKKKYYTASEKSSYMAGLRAGKRIARGRRTSGKRRY